MSSSGERRRRVGRSVRGPRGEQWASALGGGGALVGLVAHGCARTGAARAAPCAHPRPLAAARTAPRAPRVAHPRSAHHISLVASGHNFAPLFFQVRDGPFVPTLRTLHLFPGLLPKYRVDRGAIRFVLAGANIMAPGLTSAGGAMDDVGGNSVVGIFAEGKEHALAVGVTLASTQEIRESNKGIAVENTHYLNDGLWHTLSVE